MINFYTKNWFKFFLVLIACLFIRLIPFRAPNIEPILAAQMPFAKAYGKLVAFLFAFISMILFDIISGQIGAWTLITALAYGFLGIWAAVFFKNKANNALNYAKFAVMGTLAFDIVTGLSIGPLFFNQPFMSAVAGQIPFTALHLIGNVSFAMLLSPPLYRFAIGNGKVEARSIMKILKPRQA